MIVSRTYTTTPGLHFMHHPSISGVRILGVKREGTGLVRNYVPFTIGNREFGYFAARIFVDITNPFFDGEKLWVLYET